MTEYAVVDNGSFVEFRHFDEPPTLAGKPYRQFLEVLREEGEPFTGEENGKWVIRTAAPEAVVPNAVTPRQARLALLQLGILDEVEAAVEQAETSVRIEWEYAIEIRRDNALLAQMAGSLGLDSDALDQLFVSAAEL